MRRRRRAHHARRLRHERYGPVPTRRRPTMSEPKCWPSASRSPSASATRASWSSPIRPSTSRAAAVAGRRGGEIEGRYPAAVLEQAQQSCQSLFDQLPESAIGGGSESSGDDVPGPEDVEALRRLPRASAANGIPEWPDPKADGTFPLIGTPLEAEGKSPRMIVASEACQQHWGGGITSS